MTKHSEGRMRIGAAIQEDGPALENADASVLTGWVVVAEWMDDQGRRWLSKNSSDAVGETLTSWAMNGMLHEALHTDWPDAEEEDDA